MSKRKSMPSMQRLAVFEVAARHLSFTKAAEELATTQPAISQKVKSLEDELGVILFKRIYRGVELTAEGQRLFDCVYSGFQEIQEGVAEIVRRCRAPRLNVATDSAFASFWLLPKLPNFQKMHPDIEIRVITSESQLRVLTPDIDIALIFCSGKVKDAHTELLFQEEVMPIYSPSFLKQYGPINDLTRLADVPRLELVTDKNSEWLNWEKVMESLSQGKSVNARPPTMTFNNYMLAVQAAIAGQGVVLGWSKLIDELIANGLLIGTSQLGVRTNNGYYIVESEKNDNDRMKNIFYQWLKSSVT